MSLTTSPPRVSSSKAVRLEVTSIPGRFLLVGPRILVEIDARPSLRRAQAWERSVRRIEGVEFCRCDGAWTARLSVVGHRLPTRRTIPLGTAVGLGLRGHRLSVCPDTSDTDTDTDGGHRGRLSL